MASEQKIVPLGEAREPPQAITITIVDPSALGNASLDSSLVASVETQDSSDPSSIVMVTGEEHDAKDIMQTVTETHMGTEDLPIISSISNREDEEEDPIVHETKLSESYDGGEEETETETREAYESIGPHCLVCNLDLTSNESDEQVPVFKTQTTTTQRRVAVFLSSLIGQKLTSRKAHSDILCRRCFSLLDRVDSLEVEIRETKEEIVNKYQETVSAYGGRARRRKPATAKKTDYVFPKVEPEDEADQLLDMELDSNFEPQVEDLMEEDPGIQDEEWEPEFKKPRIKRENTDPADTGSPPKRKRGRPRKDSTRSKDAGDASKLGEAVTEDEADAEEQQSTQRSVPDSATHEETPDSSPVLPDSDSLSLQLANESLTCGCGTKSSSLMEHVQHVFTHAGGAFKCPECACSYTTSPGLARHQRLVHSPFAPSVKSVADSGSASKGRDDACRCGEKCHEDLLGHARGHLTGQEECPVCGLRILTSRALEAHVELKHLSFFYSFLNIEDAGREEEKGTIQPVRCDVCGKVVSTTSRLARHRYHHHPEHYPWLCSSCNLSFSSLEARSLHSCPSRKEKEAKESGAAHKHECSVCGIVCKSAVSLERHKQKSHASGAAAPFSCPVCSRTMASRKALTDHLRYHRRQGFPCHICGAKLKSSDSLSVHMNEIHTHEVRIQCKQCPQVFFSSGRLAYHMKRHHTDRRSYTNLCHLCGKAYPYPSELRLHLRSHRNERPYKCDQCAKSFLKQGDLTYHKRSHTGERPHKCPHCDARFPRPSTLMSHIRFQHLEKPGVGTVSVATTTSVSTSATTTTITSTPNIITTCTPIANSTGATVPTIAEATASVAAVAPYVASGTAADAVVSSAPFMATVNAAAFPPRPPAVTVMTVPNGVQRGPAPPTLVPVVDGQLVNTVVGSHVTEMQPVQYVQVDGLSGGQAVQAVPQAVQGVEYAEAATLPYQIVHLQIL
ncbi:zinc finger and BTB domain-containing protein 17-like isoform X5 [Eriocheir sinensis]|uniref:zinc finger and BTB domain-containing protein 17-like isoform X5 n=1 Tax=Eriocheir sinensis TaxID=95602 RepID=UPI0021C7937F|nr:zinc finger and BTB domain-containing protein 17-like isoform X5 [Eriocheir sinensis]